MQIGLHYTIWLGIPAVAALVLLAWTIQISTNHRSAVEDLMAQTTNTMDTYLNETLHANTKMLKQSVNTWSLTGAAVTGLSSLDSWTTDLIRDFYTSSRLSTIRFGTVGGFEQSASCVEANVSVLSRASSTGCLKSYLSDGVTPDGSTDICDYDSRYTPWYMAGERGTLSGVNNSRLTGTAYTIGDSSQLGFGAVVKSEFYGVWAAEFKLSAIGDYLHRVKDGFEGALFIGSADKTGAGAATPTFESLNLFDTCRGTGWLFDCRGWCLHQRNRIVLELREYIYCCWR